MKKTDSLPIEQKENARHGEVIFPVQKYSTLLSSKVPVVTPHWHEESEFTLITDGAGTYQIQLETYEVHTGDLIFIPPMHLHSSTRYTRQLHSFTYVFHTHFLGAGASDICGIRYLTPLASQRLVPPFIIGKSHPVYKEVLNLFYALDSVWKEKESGYELMIKSYLLSLVALLIPHCVESSTLSQHQTEHIQKVKTALEYIEEHFTENISIADIAARCYFSEYYFMRFFKKYVGMPCMDYIKNLRLEKAVELFEKGETSILDVSLSAGFHNLSYFYREFKKKYGITPKQFLSQLADV